MGICRLRGGWGGGRGSVTSIAMSNFVSLCRMDNRDCELKGM